MTYKKNDQAMSLQVTEGLTVTILPDSNHEFLMTTKQTAGGYGVSDYTIRQHKKEHGDELIEGKHFVSGVSIPHDAKPGASKCTMWTKRGVVRLGFFIKSKNAKLFRDWAEDLILEKLENTQLVSLVDNAVTIIGSNTKLAARMGINPAVFSHLRHNPHLVSPEMYQRIELVCTNIIENGVGVDPEFVELLIKVEDKEVREGLFNKFMGGRK